MSRLLHCFEVLSGTRSSDGHDLSGFGNIATLYIWPVFPFGLWTIVHGGQKIESNGICGKKFRQVGVEVHCMQAKLSECGSFGFGDIAIWNG